MVADIQHLFMIKVLFGWVYNMLHKFCHHKGVRATVRGAAYNLLALEV